jgi:hypothetical protein
MKKLLIAAATLALLTGAAKADAVNNLTFGVLPDNQQVPQSISDPCIICGTTQAHNPVGFGYNNFDTTGNTSALTLFSTNFGGAQGSTVAPGVQGTAYSGSQLEGFGGGGFSVAIDVNSAEGGPNPTMRLISFQLIDLSLAAGSRVIFDYSPTNPTLMPDIQQGNGFADYLLSGFCLTCAGVMPGDNLIFRAQFDGATDGPDSFYIIPAAAVPGPIVGAGIPGLLAAAFGLFMLNRYRRNKRDGGFHAAMA